MSRATRRGRAGNGIGAVRRVSRHNSVIETRAQRKRTVDGTAIACGGFITKTSWALWKKHGYDKLTFDLVFGDQPDQIPVKAAYRMFCYWCSHWPYWFGRGTRSWHHPWNLNPDDRFYSELMVHLHGLESFTSES